MEKRIVEIVSKVREILRFMNDYRPLLAQPAKITICEKGEDLIIQDIIFEWDDKLIVTETGILYAPEHGGQKRIVSYDSWDEFLNM